MRKHSLVIVILSFIYIPTCFAEVVINGFASIVAGSSLEDDKSYYGYDKEISFENDSKMALQFSADLGEGLRATAQIIARGRNDFNPDFEWAYISYEINDQFMLMAGRQRFNLYKYSDYIDVGYAYHWITPPRGVYSLPFNSGEGVGLTYSDLWGDSDAEITYKYITSSISDYQPIGSDTTPAAFSAKGHIINFNFATGSFEYGLNLGLIDEYSYEQHTIIALGQAISEAGVFTQEIVDDLLPIDDGATLIGAHVKYDVDSWFILAEYTMTELDPSFLADTNSAFISGGIRFNNLTFHVTYGMDEGKPQMDAYEAMLPIYSSLPPINQIALAPLLFGTQAALTAQEEDSNYYIVGTRWDFHPSAAFKIEYTHYSDDYSVGTDAQLLAIAVDLVF